MSSSLAEEKLRAREQWGQDPCGAEYDREHELGTREFFDSIRAELRFLSPLISEITLDRLRQKIGWNVIVTATKQFPAKAQRQQSSPLHLCAFAGNIG